MSSRLRRLAAILLAGAAILAAAYVLVAYVGPAVARGMVRAVVALPDLVVWMIVSVGEGADWLTITGQVAVRVAEALTRPQLVLALIAIELVGVAALYALKHLLRDEQGSRSSGTPGATLAAAPGGRRGALHWGGKRAEGSEEVRK
jgi:hypothetical protein